MKIDVIGFWEGRGDIFSLIPPTMYSNCNSSLDIAYKTSISEVERKKQTDKGPRDEPMGHSLSFSFCLPSPDLEMKRESYENTKGRTKKKFVLSSPNQKKGKRNLRQSISFLAPHLATKCGGFDFSLETISRFFSSPPLLIPQCSRSVVREVHVGSCDSPSAPSSNEAALNLILEAVETTCFPTGGLTARVGWVVEALWESGLPLLPSW